MAQILKKEKATLRKYSNPYPFYSVDEYFMCEDNL